MRHEPAKCPPSWRRALLLLPVIGAAAAFFAFGLGRYVTLEALAAHRDWLTSEAARLGPAGWAAFVVVYAVLVAASVPGATFLTIVGGFVFGTVIGAACSVLGATTGAVAIFLLTRTAIGETLRARAGPAIQRLENGFRSHALSYLLFLRLVPVFPFFIVNLVPAFLGIDLATFVIGTALGIIPGALIYAGIGNGLGAVFAAGGTADLDRLGGDPRVWAPLAALAILSLLPIVYRSWHGRRAAG
jgi:uncharacterized membrane protein YdjX (TVP38/TMEM64 family)